MFAERNCDSIEKRKIVASVRNQDCLVPLFWLKKTDCSSSSLEHLGELEHLRALRDGAAPIIMSIDALDR